MLLLLRCLRAGRLLVLLRRLVLLLLACALRFSRRASAVLAFRTRIGSALRRRRLLFAETILTTELLSRGATAEHNKRQQT